MNTELVLHRLQIYGDKVQIWLRHQWWGSLVSIAEGSKPDL
jgi:hypothetical protein